MLKNNDVLSVHSTKKGLISEIKKNKVKKIK